MFWDPALQTGIPEVDRQHRELLLRYGDFIEAIRKGRGRARIEETIDFLSKYVDEHFRAEEALMESISFPHVERHRREHRKFRAVFEETTVRNRSSGTKLALTVEIQRGLGEWIRQHVAGEDRRIALFLREQRSGEQQEEKKGNAERGEDVRPPRSCGTGSSATSPWRTGS